ncbi:ROK family transcriptional regulator [Halomarina rubra]|uniref:ArsR family transcriptional regulator n=1 Tax=Halomarina rubra TaxID=2071873 RepID=A0ABD6B181_9EURY|nr:winged helix-turn-helix domain-containing protein [Halomarina rubra]
MSDASESSLQQCDECVAPAEAFSLIANETRLSILEALWRADTRPVRFSDLRSAVGMRDSAQFNYHLSKLTDQYVVKVEGEESGYDLRHAGEKVVRAIISGSFNEHPHLDPFAVEGSCAWCDGTLEARYDDERLSVVCRDCDHRHGTYSFPPGGLNDRSDEEVARAFDQRVRHLHCLAADGVCPECSGRMVTELHEEGDCCLGDGLRADHVCQQCDHTLCSTVGLSLLDKSPVVAFYADHGVELSGRPYWSLSWCVRDAHTEVLSRDPWRLAVTIDHAGEQLRVELDGSLRILATDRS